MRRGQHEPRRPTRAGGRIAALALTLGLGGCAPLAERVPSPQRPTLSSDTTTTRAGTLELEAGANVDPNDFFTAPVTLKAGYDDDRELYVAWDLYQVYEESPGAEPPVDGGSVEGIGDLVLGFRERFFARPEAGASAAFLAELKLPTADDDIGTGEVDFRAALIGNRAWERADLTAFYRIGILGDPNANGTNLEHALALAGSGGIAGPLSAFLELAVVVNDDQDVNDIFTTGGFQWTLTSDIVLDLGAAVGLSDDASALRLVGGLTWNFGRFF